MSKTSGPLREKVYNKLIGEIVRGQLNPGERLSEAALAKRFGVSRTPIREALLQLEKMGYVVHQKNVGSVVKKMSPQGVREIFEVVAALEAMAVELFGRLPPSPQDMAELLQLQNALRQHTQNQDFASYYQVNREFHDFFALKAGNQTLLKMIRSQWDRIYRTMAQGTTLPLNIHNYLTIHDQIIAHLESGEAEQAGLVMKAHVLQAGQLISGNLSPLP